jgi:hypothetical protein
MALHPSSSLSYTLTYIICIEEVGVGEAEEVGEGEGGALRPKNDLDSRKAP